MITIEVSEDNTTVFGKIQKRTVCTARFHPASERWLWSHIGMIEGPINEGHEMASCMKHVSEKVRDLEHERTKVTA